MSGNLRLNGATSGYSELAAPDVAGDQTFTFPSTGGTLDSLGRAGNILQVVYGGTSSQVSLNTSEYKDSNLSASITPSSSTSKILVLVDQSCEWTYTSSSGGMGVRLIRDIGGAGTIINEPAATTVPLTDYIAAATQHYFRLSMTILDSPATTSSVTYKTQGKAVSGTSTFQAGSTNKGSSRIVLMEVAA